MTIGMLYNGASDYTRSKIANVLGINDFTEVEINEYYQKLIKDLSISDDWMKINLVNSFWYKSEFYVKQPFIDISRKYFDAEVTSIDFTKSDAVSIINNWINEKTNGNIKDIVKMIPDNTIMYLINSLYLNGRWKDEFNKAETKLEVFTKSNKQEQKVNMMVQTMQFLHYADNHLQCVEKPFGNGAFDMVFILPAVDKSLEQLIDYLFSVS